MTSYSHLIDYNYILKIILVGDTNTGKTTILNNYINLRRNYIVNDPTIGIDFASRIITLQDNTRVKLQCWDTAGQEKFRCIVRSYFRDVCCYLLTFDVTCISSFRNLTMWLNEIKQNQSCKKHDHPILLIGTKIDKSNRAITKDMAIAFAENNKLLYIELNALTCDMLDNSMIQLVGGAIRDLGDKNCRGIKRIIHNVEITTEIDDDTSKKPCCVIM